MTYAGFEIEVENPKEKRYETNNPIRKLIELAYPITKWAYGRGIGRYHSYAYRTDRGEWRVESDSSLISGVEFVMPPLEKNLALDTLEKFFGLIEESGCVVTHRCGLHLNISDDDKTINKANLGYFITNVNYRLLAKLWPNRVKKYNAYCIGIDKNLNSLTKDKTFFPESYNTTRSENLTQDFVQKEILRAHNNMINMRQNDVDKIRFEIRAMGGKNYHKKFKEIKITTNMLTDLLEKSCKIDKSNTNRRMISYVNRIKERRETTDNVWIPRRGANPIALLNNLTKNLKSIKKIHKQQPWVFAKKLQDIYNTSQRYTSYKHKSFDAYCAMMTKIVKLSLAQNKLIKNEKKNNIIRLTNEAIYHIVKYMNTNQTVFSKNLCNQIIKEYMTDNLTIQGNKIKLTIPECEKQRDRVWLAQYMHMFNPEIRQNYINGLSQPMLKFINKYKKKYGKGILRMSQKKIKEMT